MPQCFQGRESLQVTSVQLQPPIRTLHSLQHLRLHFLFHTQQTHKAVYQALALTIWSSIIMLQSRVSLPFQKLAQFLKSKLWSPAGYCPLGAALPAFRLCTFSWVSQEHFITCHFEEVTVLIINPSSILLVSYSSNWGCFAKHLAVCQEQT